MGTGFSAGDTESRIVYQVAYYSLTELAVVEDYYLHYSTIYGWEVLNKADRELGEQSFLTLAASIALSHHEHYDGTGYPHGQAGDQIHLSARISAMADVYDALTSARPYKEAWSHEQAVEEIVRERGSHFDPVLVDIFRDIHENFADVRRMFPG